LSKALFPIGHLEKPEVRRIAEEQGLATAKRKDSQGICFVGKVNLPDFLKQKLKAKEGDIVEIPATYWEYDSFEYKYMPRKICYSKNDGKVIGKHNGAHFFTIGQSKYLGIGGRKEKMFVIGTDIVNNIVYVGEGQYHPGLYKRSLYIKYEDWHCVCPNKSVLFDGAKLNVRIRYRQPLQTATIRTTNNGVIVFFDEPQRGITSGQFAAFYTNDNELIASGVIN
jgi:tRNA-specific 2-thiouridylase